MIQLFDQAYVLATSQTFEVDLQTLEIPRFTGFMIRKIWITFITFSFLQNQLFVYNFLGKLWNRKISSGKRYLKVLSTKLNILKWILFRIQFLSCFCCHTYQWYFGTKLAPYVPICVVKYLCQQYRNAPNSSVQTISSNVISEDSIFGAKRAMQSDEWTKNIRFFADSNSDINFQNFAGYY